MKVFPGNTSDFSPSYSSRPAYFGWFLFLFHLSSLHVPSLITSFAYYYSFLYSSFSCLVLRSEFPCCFFSELLSKTLLLPRVLFSALFLTLFVKFHKFRRQSGLIEGQRPVVVQIFDYIPKFSLLYPNHLCKTAHSAAWPLPQLAPDCPWYLLLVSSSSYIN